MKQTLTYSTFAYHHLAIYLLGVIIVLGISIFMEFLGYPKPRIYLPTNIEQSSELSRAHIVLKRVTHEITYQRTSKISITHEHFTVYENRFWERLSYPCKLLHTCYSYLFTCMYFIVFISLTLPYDIFSSVFFRKLT